MTLHLNSPTWPIQANLSENTIHDLYLSDLQSHQADSETHVRIGVGLALKEIAEMALPDEEEVRASAFGSGHLSRFFGRLFKDCSMQQPSPRI